jgi:hypothetical protein
LFSAKSYPQEFKVSELKLDFNADKLVISYNILNNRKPDLFYVWVEMKKKNDEPVIMRSLSGESGERIKGGMNKKIIWTPGRDSIYLNEVVFVNVKAERYVKTYNRVNMALLSTVLPGLGQTVLSSGKPLWLTGVATYATIAGGIIIHKNSLRTYDSYLSQEDPLLRDDIFAKSQKQMKISNALIITGVAYWIANIIWVSVIPVKYKPLKNFKMTLDQSVNPDKYTPQLTFLSNF